jgi:hypothetical protein
MRTTGEGVNGDEELKGTRWRFELMRGDKGGCKMNNRSQKALESNEAAVLEPQEQRCEVVVETGVEKFSKKISRYSAWRKHTLDPHVG